MVEMARIESVSQTFKLFIGTCFLFSSMEIHLYFEVDLSTLVSMKMLNPMFSPITSSLSKPFYILLQLYHISSLEAENFLDKFLSMNPDTRYC